MFKRMKKDTMIAILIFLGALLLGYSFVDKGGFYLLLLATNIFTVYMLIGDKFHSIVLALISVVGISLIFTVIAATFFLLGVNDGRRLDFIPSHQNLSPLVISLIMAMFSSLLTSIVEGAALCLLFKGCEARFFYILFIANSLFNFLIFKLI